MLNTPYPSDSVLTLFHDSRTVDSTSGCPNDSRVFDDPPSGLYAIADGSGPTYGGYHRPVGLGPGWEAMLATWRKVRDAPKLRLERAMAHANAAMFRIDARSDALVHTAASMTVAGIDGAVLVVAQVGNTQGWLVRDRQEIELAPRQTLVSESCGSAELPTELQHLPSRCMGLTPAWQGEIRWWDLRDGDTLVLCTQGVWARVHEGDVAAAGAEASLSAVVDRLLDTIPRDQARALLVIRVRQD